ncbi:trypsin-like peptidase domain-containing protein [Streptomyces sp. 891-h]|uniref:S1C family serine protease n=1 Tax=Streptomyces sp. 891-h TaxID=2720714 RepID=UPI001FAAC0F1|nr:trypsin-like peptidase domain-containing protein [Streptomyces sp. 891-h]UNZ18490.1 PDZ domain-containing protein [Streptomyces sp. 891-h]
MSTENEGAAVTPAAGPGPTPPAPAQAPSGGAPTSREDGDFSLASPDSSAPGSTAVSDAVPDRTTNGADVQDTVVRPREQAGDTLVQSPQEAADRVPAEPERTGEEPTVVAPPQASSTPAAPAASGAPPAGSDSGSGSDPGSGPGSGEGGAGQSGGWGQSGAGHPTPPPPPPYGGGPGGPGGPAGPGGPGGPAGPGGPGGGGVPPHDPWAMPSGPGPHGPEGGGKKRRGGLLAGVLVAALVAGGVGGGIGFWAADRSDGGSTTISSSSDPEKLNRSPKSVAGIASKALPSVVTIRSSGGGEEGTGTGFVFDKEGHILTNNHVVANGAQGGKLTATFSDGKKYDAHIVGKAQGYDVAVLKLSGLGDRKLEPLPIANSNEVAVGDATIAIGAPFGLSGTVTTGIVSAKNRPVASSDGRGSQASYMSALQTDASINPGNSGGPLLNSQGAVIGVNSAIQPGGGGGGGLEGGQSGSVGLGFAIPSNQAKRVAEQLIKTGEPVYPVIGATVQLGGSGKGATISRSGEGGSPPITPGGPADKAGLEPGDVITKLDDTLIDSGPTLIGTIWTHQPGEKVKLTYERDGKEKTVEVTLGSRRGDD